MQPDFQPQLPTPSAQPQPVPEAAAPHVAQQSVPASATPFAAGVANMASPDEEIVDEAWVQRYEQLSRAYAHDPWLLCEEISKLRKAYLKARFGKEPVLEADS